MKLQTKILKEKKWMVYGDYFVNFLSFLGIFIIVNNLNSKLDFNYNFFILLLIAEMVSQAFNFIRRIYLLTSLRNTLRTDGIEVAEIKIWKQLIFNQGFISYNLLKLTNFLYSAKTQKAVFEQTVGNWQEEYFEALSKKEIWKARWINVRYTYAFLAAMWMKSPIGDLIQFVIKIAKP